MKFDPAAAVALHAAQVLGDPRSSDEDAAAARRALAGPVVYDFSAIPLDEQRVALKVIQAARQAGAR